MLTDVMEARLIQCRNMIFLALFSSHFYEFCQIINKYLAKYECSLIKKYLKCILF